jgi:hypothetical protein
MQVTFQFTQKDFYQALVANRNRRFLTKWGPRFLISIALFFLCFSLYAMVAWPELKTSTNILPLVGLTAFWGFLFWGAVCWTARKQFTQTPAVQGPRTAIFHGTGIHTTWDGGASDLEWKTYIGYFETKNQFLIYSSSLLFGIVPKRCLDAEQLTELRSVLALHIPDMKK